MSGVWCLRWKGSLAQALAAAGGPRGGVFRAAPTAAAGGGSSLTQDFHTRLDNLLRTLVHARPHFVRCLRANLAEQPMLFERPAVAKQVRPACCRTARPGILSLYGYGAAPGGLQNSGRTRYAELEY